jgi:hypothetical protein
VTEEFYLTDLRKAIKRHESKREYDRIRALERKLSELEPLLQQQAKLEADARRLALAGNFTTDWHRVTAEHVQVKEKIDQMKRKDHDDNDLEDIKDDYVGFQHPFLTLLDDKYNQAYDNDDLETAQALEGLRGSALPICMHLVKATNAYSEAKAARQEASVLINLKSRKEELEGRSMSFNNSYHAYPWCLLLSIPREVATLPLPRAPSHLVELCNLRRQFVRQRQTWGLRRRSKT